jgi:uncharacterized protein (DUF488 family)
MDRMQAVTATSPGPQLWTIGHSTKPIEEFLALLRSHGIQRLVDVRTIPRSRHNPQYDTEALAAHLMKATLTYLHMPQLGGLKKAKKDSVNIGWKNASFRGYADYMQTEQFQRALEQLMAESRVEPTAIMCAEAVPWRCHRSLIADALLIRGWTVRHIMTNSKADTHRLTRFAVVEADRITYPSASPSAAS